MMKSQKKRLIDLVVKIKMIKAQRATGKMSKKGKIKMIQLPTMTMMKKMQNQSQKKTILFEDSPLYCIY